MKFTTYFRGGMSSAQANALPTAISSLKWVKILIKSLLNTYKKI